MYTSIVLISAALSYVAAAPAPQVTVTPFTIGPFFLGSACYTASQCPAGIQCYAVNSMLQPTCGGQGATCTTDAQCATNSCVGGLCNGPVAPTLPLGTPCYESAQCAGGAGCYAVNYMLVPVCGNAQAPCQSNSQCAFNGCVNGFCSGPLFSQSSSISPTSPPTSSSSPTSSPISPSSPTSLSASPTYSPASSVTTKVATVSTTATLSTICSGMTTMTTAPASGTRSTSSIAPTRNSTMSTTPTATQTPKVIFTGGASKKLHAGFGGVMAIAFVLVIAV